MQPACSRITLATAVALVAMMVLPSAHGLPGQVIHAHDLRIEDGAVHGDLGLVQVRGGTNGGAISMSLQAAHADVEVYRRTAMPAGGFDVVRVPGEAEHHEWHDVALERRGEVDQGFVIVLVVDGEGWLTAADVHVGHADGVFLSERGIHEQTPGDASSRPGSDDFQDRAHAGPHGIGRVWEQAHNGTWEGDIVLEVRGLDLEGTADGEEVRVSSGMEGDGIIRSDVFVRMHLTEARIMMDAPAGAVEQTSWASTGAQAHGTTGRVIVPMPDGEAHGRLLVPAPFTMDITPTEKDLVLEFDEASSAPANALFLPEAVQDSLAVATAAAMLLLLVALAVVVVRRRTPGLADVERALERQDHESAARHAARLTKRRPDLEGAQIGHAIALAKSGRPAAAVQVAEAFIARREPSDGVLYYVMGTALMELGRVKEARAAFEAAVARTPQLLDQVALVPRAPRAPVDAQAYA